jgi:hypothetical protein
VKAQGHSHARCVVMIEAGEESGSPDLMTYVEHFSVGSSSFVVFGSLCWLLALMRLLTQHFLSSFVFVLLLELVWLLKAYTHVHLGPYRRSLSDRLPRLWLRQL